MAHVRGLHETGGLRALRTASGTATLSKLTSKLSRLDHQRALLERQLAVWTEKQRVTRHRVGLLDKEIAQIGRLIREFGGLDRKGQRHHPRAIKSGRQPGNGAAASPSNDVCLEY